MKAWLVVLERRGVFICTLYALLAMVVVAACVTLAWVHDYEKGMPPGVRIVWGLVCGAVVAPTGAAFYWLSRETAGDLRVWFKKWAVEVADDVQKINAADTSDKRGALTMKDEP